MSQRLPDYEAYREAQARSQQADRIGTDPIRELARDIFLADNWRMPKPAAIEDWDALEQSSQRGTTYAHQIARRLIVAGYRKVQP